jgi:hypothetical protein
MYDAVVAILAGVLVSLAGFAAVMGIGELLRRKSRNEFSDTQGKTNERPGNKVHPKR